MFGPFGTFEGRAEVEKDGRTGVFAFVCFCFSFWDVLGFLLFLGVLNWLSGASDASRLLGC